MFLVVLLAGCSLSALKDAVDAGYDILSGEGSFPISSWSVVSDSTLGYGGYPNGTASAGAECSGDDGGAALAFAGQEINSWGITGSTRGSARPRRAKLLSNDRMVSTGSRTPSGSALSWSVPDDHSIVGETSPTGWTVRLSEVTGTTDPSVGCPHTATLNVNVQTSAEAQGYSSERTRRSGYRCTSGSGSFQLAPVSYRDVDDDGVGTWGLVPVLVSGSHISPTGWVSSVSVSDWASFNGGGFAVTSPTFGDTSSDGETYVGTPSVELTEETGSAAPEAGQMNAEAIFLMEGVDASYDEAMFVQFPQVDMAWTCDASDVGKTQFARPTAYQALLSDLPGAGTTSVLSSLSQQLVIRPDVDAGLIGFELRGMPHSYRIVPLSLVAGTSTYSFAVSDFFGLDANGTLTSVSALRARVRFDSITGGGETIANHNVIFNKLAE